MSEESAVSVVFRTSQPDEAPLLAARLADAGIPLEIRIVVQAEREAEALGLIESYMASIGAAPHEEPPVEAAEADELLPCPNCETPGVMLGRACKSCKFAIVKAAAAPVGVKTHTAAAKSFCPECRDPLTFAAGKCPKCSEELEPLEPSDKLCPTLQHVLFRDTVGGFVCQACKKVWVDV